MKGKLIYFNGTLNSSTYFDTTTMIPFQNTWMRSSHFLQLPFIDKDTLLSLKEKSEGKKKRV